MNDEAYVLNEELRVRNPWVTMWTQPRATIQQIIDDDPKRLVLVLAALSGFVSSLDRASGRSMGDNVDLPAIFLFAAILGPLGGVFTLYLGALLLGWTGRWIGGRATYEQIRAAMAWSTIPVLWLSLLWIPELMLFGEEMFTTEMPRIEANPSLSVLLLAFLAAEFVGGVWYFVVFLKSLGQVQGFSAWRALGNVCVAAVFVLVPIAAVVALMVAFTDA